MYAMAAWKGSPKYKVQILNLATDKVIAVSETFTAVPNANGSSSANLALAAKRELEFSIEEDGDYVIRFSDESGAFDEYLLMDCRIYEVEKEEKHGDVNGDDVVDVADITAIISVMAAGASADPAAVLKADANGDGTVDVADISTVISVMAANARQF